MMYMSEYFVETKSHIAKYKDKTIYQCEVFDKTGTYDLEFKLISTKSKYEQAVILSLINFKGKIYNIKGDEYPIPKRKYPTIDISEDVWKEFPAMKIRITLEEGEIYIYNGVIEKVGNKDWVNYGAFGCAMQIQELSPTKKRYYCNDIENDDDFDDLIFEIEITKVD